MKRSPLFVIAGTAAGFAGMLSFHTHPAALAALPSASSPPTAARHPAKRAGTAPAKAKAKGSGASAAGIRSAVGATEQYGYGELAVKVTASGNHIADVAVTSIQTAEPYSQQLASQVIPTLRSEVLSGQSAQINAVSGATYTSQAYAMSLQAALDKLHIR